jgi:hypothetical protein
MPPYGAFDDQPKLLLAHIAEHAKQIAAHQSILNAELAAICGDIRAADQAGIDRERIVRAAIPELTATEVLRCLDGDPGWRGLDRPCGPATVG